MKTIPCAPRIEGNYVCLDLRLPHRLPESLNFLGKKWILKPEFHVSLFTNDDTFDDFHVRPNMSPFEKKRVMSASQEFIRSCLKGIKFEIVVSPEFFFVEKDYRYSPDVVLSRRSIIALCFVSGVAEFNNRYDSYYGRTKGYYQRHDYKPYHITLYTGSNVESRKGIGLYSMDDFKSYARRIKHMRVPSALQVF